MKMEHFIMEGSGRLLGEAYCGMNLEVAEWSES